MIAYAISDPSTLRYGCFSSDISRLAASSDMLLYRDRDNPAYTVWAEFFVSEARRYSGLKIFLHNDPLLASKLGADGVHLSSGNFALIDKIKTFETRRVDIRIAYDIDDPVSLIVTDMQKYDTGLVFLSRETFRDEKIYKGIFDLKKLVYLFGATPLYNITRSIVLMTKEEEMEAISSTSFYISETLDLSLCLCHYDPEGDFESGRRSIEHYETLSHIFHFPIQIEEKQVNPVRALKEMKNILQIAPFGRNLRKRWWLPFLSTNVDDYLLEVVHHPKLLFPVEMG
jgi:hypothetical protein